MGEWGHMMVESILGIVGLAVAYGYAVIVGHWMILPVMRELRKGCGDEGRDPAPAPPASHSHAAVVGCVERTLYVTALLMGLSQFIGLWLVIKTAAHWNVWKEKRWVFNLFLIGNGLSIGYAVVGFALHRILMGMWPFAILLIIGVGFATSWLKSYIAHQNVRTWSESRKSSD